MPLIHPLDKFFEQSSGHTSVDILMKMLDVNKIKALKDLELIKRGGEGKNFIRHITNILKDVDEAKDICVKKEGVSKCMMFVDDSMSQASDDISNKLKELIR